MGTCLVAGLTLPCSVLDTSTTVEHEKATGMLRCPHVDAYLDLPALLASLTGAQGERMRKLYEDHASAYAHARGSNALHQAWPGGYWDHVCEVGNVAVRQYAWMSEVRPLPFTLHDALLVLLAHDLEKMVRYRADGTADPALADKADKAAFRWEVLARYDIVLTPEQANALRYAEGVRDGDYRSDRRQMGPLAAFVHVCDLVSARIWYAHPLADDPWPGATRHDATALGTVPDERYDPDGHSLGPSPLR